MILGSPIMACPVQVISHVKRIVHLTLREITPMCQAPIRSCRTSEESEGDPVVGGRAESDRLFRPDHELHRHIYVRVLRRFSGQASRLHS